MSESTSTFLFGGRIPSSEPNRDAPSSPDRALRALFTRKDAGEEAKLDLRAAIGDWNALLWHAGQRLVTGSVAVALRTHPARAGTPPEVLQALDLVLEANRARNVEIARARDRFAEILASAGIVPVALKGAAMLADDRYADFGERACSDIDLLVRPEELRTGLRALRDAGCLQLRNPYSPERRGRPPAYDPIDLTDFRNEPRRSSFHVPAIVLPGVPLHLELHYRVGRADTALERLLNTRAVADKIAVGASLALPPVYIRVLQNLHHSQIKDRFGYRGILDWRHLLDARLLVTGPGGRPALEHARNAADETGVLDEFELHLWQLGRWLGVEGLVPTHGVSPSGRTRIERFKRTHGDARRRRRRVRTDLWRGRTRNLLSPNWLHHYHGPLPYPLAVLRAVRFRLPAGVALLRQAVRGSSSSREGGAE